MSDDLTATLRWLEELVEAASPGPWSAASGGVPISAIYAGNEGDDLIAEFSHWRRDVAECKANAHLAALSPALARALAAEHEALMAHGHRPGLGLCAFGDGEWCQGCQALAQAEKLLPEEART